MPDRDDPRPDAISERVSRAFARDDDPTIYPRALADLIRSGTQHRALFHSGAECDRTCIPLTPPIGSRADRLTDLARDLADAGEHGPDDDLQRARREHDHPEPR